jgi:hypothetical protein
LPTHEAFACAGLYSHWTNKNTGETINTYTILTTEANELMSEIHNSKKRNGFFGKLCFTWRYEPTGHEYFERIQSRY